MFTISELISSARGYFVQRRTAKQARASTPYRTLSTSEGTTKSPPPSHRSKRFWLILGLAFFAIVIALGVGLGISSRENEINALEPLSDSGNFWQPPVGTRWQIILDGPVTVPPPNDIPVYDIDLFLANAAMIAGFHATQHQVICYFSAGSYESNRPDSNRFRAGDKGRALDGWPDEFWLNTHSQNVRNIMKARLARAAEIGCDGVDPDNVDPYDNDNGFGLTATDSVDYIHFLATEAHSHNLSIGLKNAGALVPTVVGLMQWAVNEQCVQFGECERFRPFIDAGKPVFHIEYVEAQSGVSDVSTLATTSCNEEGARGFSTVLKDLPLDAWVRYC